jgi:hypothetical protein
MGILAINISYLRHEEVGLAAYFVRSELIISVRVSMGHRLLFQALRFTMPPAIECEA